MDGVKKALYISYDGMTDALGQSQVLPYLVGLSKKGVQITLISCEKPEKLKQFREKIEAICQHATIDWHPLKYTKRPPLLSTLWDLWAIKRKAVLLHRTKKFDLVHCRSYIAALAGMDLKKRFGLKMVFDMRGFWADERVDGKIWNISNPVLNKVYRFFKQKERLFFSESDKIVSLTENGKQEILSWNLPQVSNDKIVVIPCCVDTSLFDPSTVEKNKTEELKTQLGIQPSDYIVGYVGSIGTWYMLPEMLDYFKVLKKHQPEARFLFVTNEQPSTILNLAQEKKISSSDLLITSCFHKEMPLYISTFDVSVFFILPSYSKKASSPTKQGEIMAMGIPLVCNAGVGDTDSIVKKYSAGNVVKEFTENQYEKAMNFATSFNQKEAQKGALEYFALDNGVARYWAIYQEIIG
jgi:glycosyltransferase involved in cell wall biosynthesis